ncbi:MAG: DcaP family trimeric outer membrane transporter [Planctomycetota bacterium]
MSAARAAGALALALGAVLVPATLQAQTGTAAEGQGVRAPRDLEAELDRLRARVTELEARGGADTAEAADYRRLLEARQDRVQGERSPIEDRGNLDDRQWPAARPDDRTLDPEYRGFIPVPNTQAMIRFNFKPRLDATIDNRNTGNRYRFVPGRFPLEGSPGYGGGEQFNLNGNGTQFSIDVRAPDAPGNFRFYYQNDFFGSDAADMRFRLQHAYGQYYNIVAGFTYSVFEDPDAWPDTVDYEGPNSVIFARRPVIHYIVPFDDAWNATFGLEKPDLYLDTSFDPTAFLVTKAPDVGANLRWEEEGVGHMQLSGILRSLGAKGQVVGEQDELCWGLNLSAGLHVDEQNFVVGLVVAGEGIAGMGNDTSFWASDGAFSASGGLEAMPYYSGLLAFTHNWCEAWRSTAVYGHAQLDNASGQAADFFHVSRYASLNLVHQVGPRLSVGAELLYGAREAKGGAESDVIRFQLSLVYSLF